MLRPIEQVKELAGYYNVPVLLAGDLFHKADPGAGLANWAIKHLFPCVGIPGNHELPDHRYDRIAHSAYWTLVEAGVVTNVAPESPCELGSFGVCGFPFGYQPSPCTQAPHDFYYWVALCHAFIWKDGHGFPGAPVDARVKRYRKQLTGYAAAFFGDNHSGFIDEGQPNIMNVGGFMRRRRNERDYKPMVGILHKWGKITPHYLDCSEDKFFDVKRIPKAIHGDEDLKAVCDDIASLGDVSCDFREACRQRANMEVTGKGARKLILEALEKCQ